MVFDPLLDANHATLHAHVGLSDAEGAPLEIELMRVEQEVDIADADEFVDTVNFQQGSTQNEVGRRIPMVEEVCLEFIFTNRSIDFQRIGVDGIFLAHIGHNILAVQGDPCFQAFGILFWCGHECECRCIDLGGDVVIVHIQMAEFKVSIQQHLFKATFEVIGSQLDVGVP